MEYKRRSVLHALSLALTLAFLMATPILAQTDIHATLTPSQDQLTIGDPVNLDLEITYPAEYQVIIPKLDPNWGAYEVQSQSQAETVSNEDGTQTTHQTITVTLFDVGTFDTPVLPLTIADASGQLSDETVQPISLTVNPTLAEGDNNLMDIRPQKSMALPSVLPALMGGLLAVVAVAAVAYWLHRRRRGDRLFSPVIDNRLPFEVAFDELDRIEALNLPEKARFKEHYTLVTDCLRAYVEGQFRVHAFDRTTTELKISLRGSDISPDHVRRFVDLFADADLVKFAKLIPFREEAQHITDQARNLIDLTRPVPNQEGTTDTPPSTFGVGQSHKPAEVIQ